MTSEKALVNELESVVQWDASDKICDYIEKNVVVLFSTPHLSSYYQVLKGLDLSESDRLLPQLILAWLSYACGDHARITALMNRIDETNLSGPEESSLYYSLKAMFGMVTCTGDSLKYAKVSVDVLEDITESIYHGNALLTYGQVLASHKNYLPAAENFSASSRIFLKNKLYFLSVIATCNELLNRGRMGGAREVVQKSREALVMSSSFRAEYQTYWNMLFLPMGMGFYDLDRTHMAIDCLEKAKASVDQLGLYHMHGIIELYLFKAYFKLGDRQNMKRIQEECTQMFQYMHDKDTDLLVAYFRVLSAIQTEVAPAPSDVEKFEFEYAQTGEDCGPFVIEALVLLSLKGMSSHITVENLASYLKMVKASGFISRTQQTLLQLVDLCHKENRHSEAVRYLKEALEIKAQYGIGAEFFMLAADADSVMNAGCGSCNPPANPLGAVRNPAPWVMSLTAREREIMDMITAGKTNEEISRELFISVGTTKWHINNIFGKLEVKNRIQAIHKSSLLRSSS